MIHVNNLNKSFSRGMGKKIDAISNTSLALPDTGFVCILGESGSGKTTLLNVLGGLDTFSKGTIHYDEAMLKQYDRKTYEHLRLEQFGYVFQNYLLVEDCSVEQNVDIALEMSGYSEKDRTKRVDEALHAVNMQKFRHERVSHLSGGEKQRVVLARVLAKSPKIIFADEPSANLDRKNALMIMEIFREVSKNALVLMVSHQRDLVYSFADRIIQIENGSIVSDITNIPSKVNFMDDDGNIYLDDYLEKSNDVGNIDVHVYGDPLENARLDIVFAQGKYYLKFSEEEKGVLLNESSGISLLQTRPEEGEDRISPETLEFSELKDEPRLNPIQMVRHIAGSLISHMGIKKFFVGGLMIVNVLMISILVTAVLTILHPDQSKIVTVDSHYIEVSFENAGFSGQKYYEGMEYYTRLFLENEDTRDMYLNNGKPPHGDILYTDSELVFLGSNCNQLEKLSSTMNKFSYVSMEKLDPATIIYGHEATNEKEIVIDQWLADRMIHGNDLVLSSYGNYQDLIGEEIRINGLGVFTATIAGICQTKEPSVYIHPCYMFEIAEWLATIHIGETSVTKTLEAFESEAERLTYLHQNYDELMLAIVPAVDHMLIYSEHPEKTITTLRQLTADAKEHYNRVNISYPYKEQMDAYYASQKNYLEMIFTVGGIVLFLSILSTYYLLYADIRAQKQMLTIYYVNGVTGKYLTLAYFIDLLKILCYTVLPTIIVYKLFVWQMNLLNFTEVTISFPMYALVLVLLVFFLYISLLSVGLMQSFVKKPVARQGILE